MLATPIASIVQQHAEETAILRNTRSRLVRAPHVKLRHVLRLDDRLAAHLDGLTVAGEFGSELCDAELETPSVGRAFAAAVRAIEERDTRRLDRLFALLEAIPDCLTGIISAFGWVSPEHLKRTVKSLLESNQPTPRCVGLAACAMHGADPGPALDAAVVDIDAGLRARALRIAGQLGRCDLLPACLAALNDTDLNCRFWAGWSAVLLGDRGRGLASLVEVSCKLGPNRAFAMQVALRALDNTHALECLKRIANDEASKRELIQGAGIVGDAYYVPWLFEQMADPVFARVIGESFTFITGLDLAYLDLEGNAPENFEAGPNDDPENENVEMDPDEDLPWPDVAKLTDWWTKNSGNFQAGTRYFMGEPISEAHCLSVLKDGYQRQRIAAAIYLSLLRPGTPLFNTAAPAWRQKAVLAKLSVT